MLEMAGDVLLRSRADETAVNNNDDSPAQMLEIPPHASQRFPRRRLQGLPRRDWAGAASSGPGSE